MKSKKSPDDVLLREKEDRRLLPNVPDPENIRSSADRRGHASEVWRALDYDGYMRMWKSGIRYKVENITVHIKCKKRGKWSLRFKATMDDVSNTGALLRFPGPMQQDAVSDADSLTISFEVPPGSMPEGMEMKVKQRFTVARVFSNEQGYFAGILFTQPLSKYAARRKDVVALSSASLMLFFICASIMLMRAESFLYFKFNKWLYLYSIMAMIFLLSRYLLGAFYRPVPIDPGFTPGVTIIIPCFNEEEWISRTIRSCVNQDYPIDKLEILVVDDCSTDGSVQRIRQTIQELERDNARFKISERVRLIVQPKNGGKREALSTGALQAKHELLVFVDSDSFLDMFAIRNLVQPFRDPKMGGVSGRTDVANSYTNGLTRMQSVRYYIAFRIMKAAESVFDTVTCLSGPLSCYRKDIVLDNLQAWRNQKFLGQRATFGDDRAMTNFVLRHHRTAYQDTAVCSTIVPNQYRVFLKQQMRWKRSWLRESLMAGAYMWRKEPFSAILFYIGLVVPIAAPIVVVYNLIWIPITHRVFPTTFLVGILLMSLLMSAAQMLLRKSSTWLWGMLFCLYYEAVLLWQMPIAWVTFWKSTWGTRMTPEDVKAARKKAEKKNRKKGRKRSASEKGVGSDDEKGLD